MTYQIEGEPAEAPIRERREAPPAHIDRDLRFPLFDSLRAIAALAVFGVHTLFLADFGATAPYVRRLDVGVTLFFVISGFLLYRPFFAARVGAGRDVRVGPYAWRRFLRIVPAYWVALTIIALWVGLDLVFSADGLLFYGFAQIYREDTALLHGIGQAWTLAVEVTFYAFLPLWAMLMARLPARSVRAAARVELVALVLLALASLAFKELVVFGDGDDSGFQFAGLPRYLDHFALGMAMAVLSVALGDRPLPRGLRLLDRFPAIPWGVAAVAFWAAATQVTLPYRLDDEVTASQALTGHLLYGVVAAGIVIPAVFGDQRRGLVRRLLAHRWLLWVGAVSYGLYLWHAVVLGQLEDWGVPDALGDALPVPAALAILPVALAPALVLAALSYYVVEVPALRLKRLPADRTGVQRAAAVLGLAGAVLIAAVSVTGVPAVAAAGAVAVAALVAWLATRRPQRPAWPGGPLPGPVLAVIGAATTLGACVVLVATPPGLGVTQTNERTRAVHVAATFDGAWLRVWVDGTPQGKRRVTGPTDAGAPAIEIGSYGGGAVWRGAIDDVAIFDRALGRDVLFRHHLVGRKAEPGAGGRYAEALALTPGLVAHYRLGDADRDGVAHDAVGRAPGAYEGVGRRSAPALVDGGDRAAAFDGRASTIRIPAAALPDLRRGFTIEAWVRRTRGNENGHGAVIARPGAWDIQTDVLGRWSAGVTSRGADVRVSTKRNAAALVKNPIALQPPKPSPDPGLLVLLGGVLVAFAGCGRALRPQVPAERAAGT